jgi:hypothetical protein
VPHASTEAIAAVARDKSEPRFNNEVGRLGIYCCSAAINGCRCPVCADNRVLAGKIIANTFDLRDQVAGQAVQGRTLSEYHCYVAAKSGDRNRQGL